MKDSPILGWTILRRPLVTLGIVLTCPLLWASVCVAQSKTNPADPLGPDHAAKMTRGLELFKKQVRQVLTQRCLRCHGGKSVESEFDLSDRDKLLHGGTTGPAIVLGNSKDSLLIKLVNHAKEPHMPHNAAKLPAQAVAAIAAWIDDGAPYEGSLVAARAMETSWTQKVLPATARQFWSFQSLRPTAPPSVRDESWIRTPIDRFILAKLEAAQLKPNGAAGRRQLIRRAYFDVLGLPPAPEEVEAFVRDPAQDAYDHLIDRLLANEHYGERWGRHWLDLARFAESHGFEHDYDRPSAYHYRDFVIKALNADLPYDTFVKWQLAGDEFEPENNLALMATGYLAAGVHSTQITKNEAEKHRYDEMDDMVATLGTSMLGLTVGCARCHDHKYDPIPQRDYYQLLSTFTTTVRSEIDLNTAPEEYKKARAIYEKDHAPLAAALQKYETQEMPARAAKLSKVWAAQPDRFQNVILDLSSRTSLKTAALAKWLQTTDPEWRKLRQAVYDHQKKAPTPKLVKTLISTEGLPAIRLHTQGADFCKDTHFLRRGDPEQKEGIAPQGFLQVLMSSPDAVKHWQTAPPKGWRTSYRRRALANWLTDLDQGAGQLLARVVVNRLWQHHMGRGLVATPSDFGSRGERPSHPELLEWLAAELIQNGWHLKPIHKLIMTSAVYMESSEFAARPGQLDPDNKLLWRRPPHRLEAEIIRDSLLTISGSMDSTMYGPGTLDESSRRRSIYFTVKRSKLVPMMTVFDAPEALGGVGDRPTTTIAPQALLLMNNPNVHNYARGFATRITSGAKTTNKAAVKSGYMIAFARLPDAEEIASSLAFLDQQSKSYAAAGRKDGRELALRDFCHVLMCMNEFVYVD